jgi:hypothetical protein
VYLAITAGWFRKCCDERWSNEMLRKTGSSYTSGTANYVREARRAQLRLRRSCKSFDRLCHYYFDRAVQVIVEIAHYWIIV